MRRVGRLVGPELVRQRTDGVPGESELAKLTAMPNDVAAEGAEATTANRSEEDESHPAPDTNLLAKLLALQERVALSERTRLGGPGEDEPRTVAASRRIPRVQMPLWSEHHRPVLHDLVRSALFTCRQAEARSDYKRHLVASVENVRITYTGQELRQRDLDVYLQVLHAARGMVSDESGEWVDFDARALVKQLRWTQNRRSLLELRDAVRRMQACGLEVTSRRDKAPPLIYGGPLVLEYAGVGGEFDEVVRWRVRLNPRIAAVFRPGNYARIDWGARTKLSPLGKWLQAFYATNVQPYPMKVDTLRKLCGSSTTELRFFRAKLRDALGDLVAEGVLHAWRIDNDDKVHVEREATALPTAG